MKRLVAVSLASVLVFSTGLAQAAVNVKAEVAKRAAILGNMHKKASKALVNAAQDQAYVTFLSADEGSRPQHKHKVDEVSLNVQRKFHVEEMCLISADGPEFARIVGNKIANDLSEDESGAIFFKPGFSAKPRTVYVSPIYMSPDAEKWVVAYVTPVLADGEKKAILHYEHGLDVFQKALNKGVKGVRLLAVNEDGYVVSDSERDIPVTKQGDKEDPADYFASLDLGGLDLAGVTSAIDGSGKVNGKAAAYKKVEHWTLIAIEK